MIGGGSDGPDNTIEKSDIYKALTAMPGNLSSQQMQDTLQDFGSGKTSLQDAITQARGTNSSGQAKAALSAQRAALQKQVDSIAWTKKNDPDNYDSSNDPSGSLNAQIAGINQQIENAGMSDSLGLARTNQLFIDPQTAGKAAASQVQDNSLLSGMFGKGGINDQRQAQESELASRGYSLQPEDYEAYGQASDNIARQYGGYENSLGQALASHGLSAGGGAPAVAYSGLQGNKLEQLGNQQRQIAQARMQTNLSRLTQAQSAVNQGASLANTALSNQEAMNFQGVDDYNQMLANSLNATVKNQQQYDTAAGLEGPGFGENLAAGALGAFTGKAAGAIGTGVGNSVLGTSGTSTKATAPTDNGNVTPSEDAI